MLAEYMTRVDSSLFNRCIAACGASRKIALIFLSVERDYRGKSTDTCSENYPCPPSSPHTKKQISCAPGTCRYHGSVVSFLLSYFSYDTIKWVAILDSCQSLLVAFFSSLRELRPHALTVLKNCLFSVGFLSSPVRCLRKIQRKRLLSFFPRSTTACDVIWALPRPWNLYAIGALMCSFFSVLRTLPTRRRVFFRP